MNNPQTQNKQQAVVQRSQQTLAQCISSETWKTEIQKVLPRELLIEAFLRVTRTVAGEQKFSQCEPKTFLSALLKCARAGLVPDGIHAHLIPFGREVNCIFDWKGVVDVAARNGIEVVPKVICEHDEFSVDEDDGTGKTILHHRWGKAHRGTIVGYYSRARKTDGTVDYEFMTLEEVEAVRQNYSNAKNSKAWEKSFDEMGKKTVIKRHSKRWPLSQEARAALVDDESDDLSSSPLQISRPMFSEPRQVSAPSTILEPESTPAPESEAPQADAPAEEVPPVVDEPRATGPQGNAYNPLKALRSLLKLAKIKESELLDFWAGTGASDGSQSSLEEVQIALPQLVTATCEKWGEFSATLLAQKRKVGGE